MSLRDEAEKKLRSLGAEYQKNPNAETLKAVEHQALLLLNLDPARSSEAVALLKEVLPTVPQPPSAGRTLDAKPTPTSESERRFTRLSEEQKARVLEDLKAWMEQGPRLKGSL